MDRKSIIALVLIAVVIILMPYYQKMIMGDKYKEQQAQVEQDTLAKTATLKDKAVIAEKERKPAPVKQTPIQPLEKTIAEKEKEEGLVNVVQDSSERIFTIENDRILVKISNKGGGGLREFILKDFTKYDSSRVNMISPEIKNNLFLGFQNNSGDFIDANDYLFFSERKEGKKYLKKG